MDDLLKVLTQGEKKIDVMTVRYKELNKNKENETSEDAATRASLFKGIAAIKKTNTVIVNHYLGEHTLNGSEIEAIVNLQLK